MRRMINHFRSCACAACQSAMPFQMSPHRAIRRMSGPYCPKKSCSTECSIASALKKLNPAASRQTGFFFSRRDEPLDPGERASAPRAAEAAPIVIPVPPGEAFPGDELLAGVAEVCAGERVSCTPADEGYFLERDIDEFSSAGFAAAAAPPENGSTGDLPVAAAPAEERPAPFFEYAQLPILLSSR